MYNKPKGNQSKNGQIAKSARKRECSNHEITIGFKFASRQISEQRKAKPKKVLNYFDGHLKMTFNKL